MSGQLSMNRRRFLKGSAALAGGLAMQGVLPNGARAQQPASANETINVGIIGCGGMGGAHQTSLMRLKEGGYPVNIVAVCDVYSVRAEDAAARTGGQVYSDYRKVLERDDIDAVTIATPDHWHARMTIEAAEAGKDVYCEKPMTHWTDIGEASAVVHAIARHNRVMQVGTQGMSDSIWEQISEKVADGAIGKLISAQASDMRNGPLGVYDPKSHDGRANPQENLDWDMWLGSAPKREWDSGRFFAYRSFWDYSGGVGTDFFPHILTPLVRSMNLDFPKRVTAIGGQYAYTGDGREVPDIFNLMIEYPEGPNVVLMGSLANGVNVPMVMRGHEGTVHPWDGPGAVIRPEKSVKPDGEEILIERTRGGSLDEHFRDFLDCVKSRNKPRSNELLGYRVMAALHMGIRSFREGRTMEFHERV